MKPLILPRAARGVAWEALAVAGLVLGGCARQRAAEAIVVVQDADAGTIHVRRSSGSRASLYYPVVDYMGPYQMLSVRFRDSSGQLIETVPRLEGWWTPLIQYSGTDPDRWNRLAIPPGGVTLERDVAKLTFGMRYRPSVPGPCLMQVRFRAYRKRDMSDPIMGLSEWAPSLCPGDPGLIFSPYSLEGLGTEPRIK